MSVRKILTAVQFCVSGLPKEDLVNVTRIGKCQDECQGNTDSYTDSCTISVMISVRMSFKGTRYPEDTNNRSVLWVRVT